jgi:hypothetical protein
MVTFASGMPWMMLLQAASHVMMRVGRSARS